jgi:hypothetical protein
MKPRALPTALPYCKTLLGYPDVTTAEILKSYHVDIVVLIDTDQPITPVYASAADGRLIVAGACRATHPR